MSRSSTSGSKWLPLHWRGTLQALGLLLVTLACGADAPRPANPDAETPLQQAERIGRGLLARYEATPPGDRVAWGGLAAAALLGMGVMLERSRKLRRKRIIPDDFTKRFLDRMRNGKLDRGKALDYCELNPSPAARVALAAVRRWGRPVVDMERAAGLAYRVETDHLRRNVGTLRRIAALAPLLGLLGTLVAIGRVLVNIPPGGVASSWGPALAQAIGPLTTGVALATLALVAYDAFAGKVEALSAALDRIAAETIDAIALSLPNDPPRNRPAPTSSMSLGSASDNEAPPSTTSGPARTPHQSRAEPYHPSPKTKARPARPPVEMDDDEDLY